MYWVYDVSVKRTCQGLVRDTHIQNSIVGWMTDRCWRFILAVPVAGTFGPGQIVLRNVPFVRSLHGLNDCDSGIN